jgi:hypothetical protein
MITFDKINRRVHLYSGLFLLPWLMMYGLSSFLIIHQSWFFADKKPVWEPVFEKNYDRLVSDQTNLRDTAQEILKEFNLEGAFWVNKPKPETLEIDRYSFWGSTHLTYSIKDHKLKAERQRVPVGRAVIRMHFRGGYSQAPFWDKFWGSLVDAACVGIIIWVASGLIMWWRLPRLRAWGAIAVVGGFVSFLLLVWKI